MIKYFCDWCKTEIQDDDFMSERIVTMPFVNAVEFEGRLHYEPYYTQWESNKKKSQYLLCDKCISRIAELRENIKRNFG